MPSYSFVVCKDSRAPDSTQAELTDIHQARAEAVMLIAREMKDYPDELWKDEEWHVEVTDEWGLILFTVFTSAIHAASTFQR